MTSIFVTHDQDEALEVADRVVVMNDGRVEQAGTPEEVFHRPRTEFVMEFLGHVNRFHGRLEGGMVSFASLSLASPQACGLPAGAARVFVRPHEFEVKTHRNGRPSFPATVHRVHAAGSLARLELVAESGEAFQVDVTQERYRALGLAPGRAVFVAPRAVRVFGVAPTGAGTPHAT